MLQPKSTPAAFVLASLQHDVVSLSDRIESLPRRLALSHSLSIAKSVRLSGGLAAACLKAFGWSAAASHAVKPLEAAAEEALVGAAQLEAYAGLLEREAEDGEDAGTAAVACALLSISAGAASSSGFVAITRDSASLLLAIDAAVRVRDGIDPHRCSVSGQGRLAYTAGENGVTVCAVDDEGDAVESMEAEDVTVCVSTEGASVMAVAVGEAGVVTVVYRVPNDSVMPVALMVSVCGVVLPGSPWIVQCLLADSVILGNVAPARRAAFLRELSAVWLPGRSYTLLYRGSRHGMYSRAFHTYCDGQGPTLVLIRCNKGNVFGGYAGASWVTPPLPYDEYAASPDSFLLSVVGPHSPDPVRFPVVSADRALYFSGYSGPVFDEGLTVQSSNPGRTALFGKDSNCGISGRVYEDVLGKGNESLTGSRFFVPTEIEAFAVAPASS